MKTEQQDIDYKQIWDLGDLYQGLDDPCLEADHDRLEQAIAHFESRFAPRLELVFQEAELMAAALDEYARIQTLLHDLMVFAVLEWNVATQDTAVNSFRDKLNRQVSEWSNRLEFFRQALTHLEASQLEDLLCHREVAKYAAFLQRMRRFQPYLRSESEERLLQLMRQFSRQRWLDFYTQTTSSWIFNVKGEELTEDQAMDSLRKTDPDLRLTGYESVFGSYHQQRDFITYIYNTLIQEYAQEANLRVFETTLAQQAFEQELKSEQVLHLLDEVRARLPLFQRYYRVLRQSLDLKRLRSCDISAPLRSQDWQVDWEQGREILLQALAPLGPEIHGRVAEFFSQRWIHARPLKGKSAGAFCAPTAQQHPYVMMNWNGNLYSLTALTHELGHGLHFYETVQDQHVLHLMPPLFLAETASTLNEYFLAHYLMEQSSDPD
ncbi:MAG: M3 family oligoendopeptidase, partial [Candidatus Sericytochromatia bacterium]